VTAKDQMLSRNLTPVKKTCMLEISGEEIEIENEQKE